MKTYALIYKNLKKYENCKIMKKLSGFFTIVKVCADVVLSRDSARASTSGAKKMSDFFTTVKRPERQ
jgi:hypothetical protein